MQISAICESSVVVSLSESAAFSLIHQCTTNQDTRLECGDYLRSRERCCPAGHAALFSCHNLFACPGKTATFPSAQTAEAALRNFLQQRIDLFSHQLLDGHALV